MQWPDVAHPSANVTILRGWVHGLYYFSGAAHVLGPGVRAAKLRRWMFQPKHRPAAEAAFEVELGDGGPGEGLVLGHAEAHFAFVLATLAVLDGTDAVGVAALVQRGEGSTVDRLTLLVRVTFRPGAKGGAFERSVVTF